MGVDFSFNLVMGFEFPQEDVQACFLKSKTEHTEGVFHFEDRFDPKTGNKIEPEKVWDKRSKTKTEKWLDIDGEIFQFNSYKMESVSRALSIKFDCYVTENGNYMEGKLLYTFQVDKPFFGDYESLGRISFYKREIPCKDLEELLPKVFILKNKLELVGLKVPEPRIFLSYSVS